jgi:hypothetical protein
MKSTITHLVTLFALVGFGLAAAIPAPLSQSPKLAVRDASTGPNAAPIALPKLDTPAIFKRQCYGEGGK